MGTILFNYLFSVLFYSYFANNKHFGLFHQYIHFFFEKIYIHSVPSKKFHVSRGPSKITDK